MIAAMAMIATVACDKEDEPGPGPGPGAVEVTMTAPTEIQVGKTGTITATLTKAADADVTVKAVSADLAVLTVADIKITKGTLTGTATATAVKAGSSKVSFTADGVTVKTPDLTITVKEGTVEPPVNKYGEIEFAGYQWAGLGSFTLGTTKIEGGDGGVLYEGAAKLDANFTVNFMPSGASGATGATDLYSIIIYADWNNDFKFDGANEKVFEKLKFAAGSAPQDITGTITIPADAAASSMIRVVSFFVEDASGTAGESDVNNGVGYIESGSAFDITYTK